MFAKIGAGNIRKAWILTFWGSHSQGDVEFGSSHICPTDLKETTTTATTTFAPTATATTTTIPTRPMSITRTTPMTITAITAIVTKDYEHK